MVKGRVIEPGKKSRSARGSRRMRVLEVAARTLNRIGVSSVSLPAIAKELGVSRAALYYYFDDQEDLVFQSYRRTCEILEQHLVDAEDAGGDSIAILASFIDRALATNGPEIAALNDVAYLGEERRASILQQVGQVRARLTDILDDGVRRGHLRSCSNTIVAGAILGLVFWRPTARIWRSSDPLSDRDLVDAIKSLLKFGIASDRRVPFSPHPIDLRPELTWTGNVFDASALVEAKQESLLAAASWLFNLKGIDATSLDEIAAKVGVTKTVIYHNVGDKATLVARCFRRSFAFYEDITRRAAMREGSPLAAILAATCAYAEAGLREDIAPLAPLSGVQGLPDDVLHELNVSSQRMMEGFLAIYEEGQRDGSIRPLNARAIIAIYPGTFEWLPKWYDILSEAERLAAPFEIAELNRIGLLPV